MDLATIVNAGCFCRELVRALSSGFGNHCECWMSLQGISRALSSHSVEAIKILFKVWKNPINVANSICCYNLKNIQPYV